MKVICLGVGMEDSYNCIIRLFFKGDYEIKFLILKDCFCIYIFCLIFEYCYLFWSVYVWKLVIFSVSINIDNFMCVFMFVCCGIRVGVMGMI